MCTPLPRLGEYLQDEVVASPLPLHLQVCGLSLSLTEDSPPTPGYPAPPPLLLAVPGVTVTRDREGVLSVMGGQSPASTAPAPTTSPTSEEARLRAELELAREEVGLPGPTPSLYPAGEDTEGQSRPG